MLTSKTLPLELALPINIEQENKLETIPEYARTHFISNLQIDKINKPEDTAVKIIPHFSLDLYRKSKNARKKCYGILSNLVEKTKEIEECVKNNIEYDELEFLETLHLNNKYDKYNKDKQQKSIVTGNELADLKIYVIVKPTIVKAKYDKACPPIEEIDFVSNVQMNQREEPKGPIPTDKIVYCLLPISNYDRMSDQGASRIFLMRDILFQHKGDKFIQAPDPESRPNSRGNRPYDINHSISTNLPFQYERPYQEGVTKPEDLDIEDLILEAEELYDENDGECKIFRLLKDPTEDSSIEEPEWNDWVQVVWSPDFIEFENEYTAANLDSSLVANPQKYFPRTDKISGKDIIPMFASLEEAEKLLLTVIEDLLAPYRRQQLFATFDYVDALPIYDHKYLSDNRFHVVIDDRIFYRPQNIDYLDEPYSFAYKGCPPNGGMPVTKSEHRLNRLAENRKIQSVSNYADHFENYDTLHQLFVYEDHPAWFPKVQTALLQTALNTEIVEMRLGDFLELWYKNETKKGEILYIPPASKFRLFKLNLGSKNLTKKIHQYQKTFHKQAKRNKSVYSYKIKANK